MKFNRTTRRLLEYLQKANRPKVIDIIESVHILAQAGLVEYEAYQAWPDMVLAWAAPLTDEYTWLASRKQNPTKEQTMATITLDIETMNVDSLGAKMQGVIIRAEVPDSDLPAFLTLVSKLATNKESHVCKCEASNGDKRPGTAATYHGRGKERGTPDKPNAFTPMDVD